MKEFLKSFDYYGDTINLYINRSTKYGTITGGALTILTLIFIITITILNIMSFTINRPLTIIMENKLMSNFSPIILYNDTFFTVFNFLENNKGINLIKNYNYSIDAYTKLWNINGEIKSNLILTECINTDIIKKSLTYESIIESPMVSLFKYIGERSNCIVLDNNTHYLGGEMIYSGNTSGVKIKVDFDFSRDNLYKNYENTTTLNLFFLDKYPAMKDELGFSEYISFYSIEIDFTKDYSISIILQKNKIISDTGLFYSSTLQQNEYINIKSIIVSEKTRNNIDGKFKMEISFFLDKMENSFYRNYMKLDSLFANIGAFASLFNNLSFFLSKIINYKSLELKLINKFFELKEQKEKVKEKMLKIKRYKIVKERKLSNTSFLSVYSNTNFISNIKSISFSKNDRIHFSILDFFCNKKRKRFNIGLNILRFNLDIVVLLKRILNLDTFKEIIFNKDLLKFINAFRINVNVNEFDFNDKMRRFKKENFIWKYKNQKEYILDIAKRMQHNNIKMNDFFSILKSMNISYLDD